MTADHLTYRRATSVSILGLAIQAVLATVALLYGLFGQDPSALFAAYGMYLGVPIWFALILVFHQHRLERLEAMEADAYRRSSAAQASVFEESATDQTAQAGRLAWMHKWFLPVVGLLVGGAYVGVGSYLTLRGHALGESFGQNGEAAKAPAPGWAIAIGISLGVIGFIFARFVAGMAKQKAWSLLHAGSASAVLCSLCGLAVALAHFMLVAFRVEWGIRWLPFAIGVAMVVLGAEMLLHFVLNLYRPRRPGVYLRPAFDSRVLAFVAAPDRLAASISDAINYQFGFNVSSTWFYRLFARSLLPLVILLALTMWLLTCFVVVQPDQQALVLGINGTVTPYNDGLIIKKPWPLDQVEVFDALAVHELNVGSGRPADDPTNRVPLLWTTTHSQDEQMVIVQPSSSAAGSRDLALLAVEVPIQYIVRDLKKYKLLAQTSPGDDPEKMRRELLSALASGVVIQQLATYTVDELLGDRRAEIGAALRKDVQAAFDAHNAGVEILFLGVSGVHPKNDVAPNFEAVVGADQQRATEIEAARKYEIETLAGAAGDVDRAREIIKELDALDAMKAKKADAAQIEAQEILVMDRIIEAGGGSASVISKARADRWGRALGERAKAVRIEGQTASYRAAPLAYKTAVMLEALRQGAFGNKVYISPIPGLRVRFNDEQVEPDLSAIKPATLKDQEK